MKRISTLLLTITLLSTVLSPAQNHYKDGGALIPLNVVLDDAAGFPASSQTFIKEKLRQIILKNGMGAADYSSRFAITASVFASTKDIVPGPPMMISETVDYTFYIVDNLAQKVFSSTSLSIKAVDNSEDKVIIRSIRSINPKNEDLVNFVSVGREQIVLYYNSQIDNIIKQAHMLAGTRDYDKAFFLLVSVPEACQEAFDKSINAASQIFKDYVNYEGEKNLAKAKAEWAAQQNSYGASLAGEYLSRILPDAACYSKAEALYKEIKAKVLDDWHFEMKKYSDEVSLEKQRIEAWKQVGIAYGNHQQPSTTNWLFK